MLVQRVGVKDVLRRTHRLCRGFSMLKGIFVGLVILSFGFVVLGLLTDINGSEIGERQPGPPASTTERNASIDSESPSRRGMTQKNVNPEYGDVSFKPTSGVNFERQWYETRSGDPFHHVKARQFGYEAKEWILVGANNSVFYADHALSNFRTSRASDIPSSVEEVPIDEDCTFRRPLETEHIANVNVNEATAPSNVWSFSREQLIQRTRNFVRKFRLYPRQRRAESNPHNAGYSTVDIVLTASETPIYLILQSRRKTIWNVHKSADVRIAHIAIITASSSGIANVDPSIPVEASTVATCGVPPISREPQVYWRHVERANAGERGFQDIVDAHTEKFAAYSKWFEGTFGIPSESNVIGMRKASHVLVGSMPAKPENRVPYTPLDEATIRLMTQDNIHLGSEDSYVEMHSNAVRNLGAQAAGGQLELIRVKNAPTRSTPLKRLTNLVSMQFRSKLPKGNTRPLYAHLNPGDLSAGRRVLLDEYIMLDDILEQDEQRPTDDLHALYVEARSMRYLAKECEVAKTIFAESCAPEIYDVVLTKDTEGLYKIDGGLVFSQLDPIGAMPDADNTELRSFQYATDIPDPLSFSDLSRARQLQYVAAQNKCDELRVEWKNCAIFALDVRSRQFGDSKLQMLPKGIMTSVVAR